MSRHKRCATLGDSLDAFADELANIEQGKGWMPISKEKAARHRNAVRRLRIILKDALSLSLVEMVHGDIACVETCVDYSSSQHADNRRALAKMYEFIGEDAPIVNTPVLEGTLGEAMVTLDSWLTDMVSPDPRSSWTHKIQPRSARNYRVQLDKMIASELGQVCMQTAISNITGDDVMKMYLAPQTNAVGSRKTAISLLRALEKITGRIVPAIADLPQPRASAVEPAKQGQFLGVRSIEHLLAAHPSELHPTQGVRSKALVAFVLGTLADEADVRTARFSDILKDTVIMRGYPLDRNCIMLTSSLMGIIKNYVTSVRTMYPGINFAGETHLFFNPQNPTAPLSSVSLYKYISQAIEGVLGYGKESRENHTGVGIKNLRVSSARTMYAEGIEEAKLEEWIGGSDLANFIHLDSVLKRKRLEYMERKNYMRQGRS